MVPPNGGWGWVIVAASFMCNVAVDGIIFSFGSIQREIVREFGASKARVALVGSFQTGLYLMSGEISLLYKSFKNTVLIDSQLSTERSLKLRAS